MQVASFCFVKRAMMVCFKYSKGFVQCCKGGTTTKITAAELLKIPPSTWNSGEISCSVDLTKPAAFWCRWSWRLGEPSTDNILCMACSSWWLLVALGITGVSEARVLGIAVFCYVKLIKLRRKQDKWVCQYFAFLVLRCSHHLFHILMGSTQTLITIRG